MLYEFITTYREAIIAKTRIKVSTRPWPPASTSELENGLPIFLTQLADTLRWEKPAANLGALPMHTDPSGAAGLRPDFEAIRADVREHGNRDRQRTRESRKSLGAPDRQTVSPPLRRASPTSTRKNALRHLTRVVKWRLSFLPKGLFSSACLTRHTRSRPRA